MKIKTCYQLMITENYCLDELKFFPNDFCIKNFLNNL